MKLKKINAVLAFLLIVFIFAHIIVNVLLMLGMIPYVPKMNVITVDILYLFISHVLLSIYIVLFKTEKSKKLYVKKNLSTYIQRISGILLIILLIIHCLNASNYYGPNPNAPIQIIPLLLTALVHMIVSIPKGFVTLGINLKGTLFQILLIILSIAASFFIVWFYIYS